MLRGSFSAAIRVIILVLSLAVTSACSGDEEFILVYSKAPPGEVVAGDLWPEIHVQLADLRGDGQGTSGVVITMELFEKNGNSKLLGTVSRATRGGVAVFDDITYTLAEDIEIFFTATGYRSSAPVKITVIPNVPDHPRIVGEVLLNGEIDETGRLDPSEPLFDDPNGDTVPIPAGELWPDFLVQIEDAFGNVVETSRDITLAVTDGSGVIQSENDLFEGRTVLGRYIFDSRNAIFSETAGEVNVTVLSGNLDPARARPVTIIPDVPADLTFEQQPVDVSTDDRQVVTVAVRDQFGNIIRDPHPGNDLDVEVEIDTDPSGTASLMVPNATTMMLDPLSQITISAVDGIATFEVDDAIQINRPGLGFRLGANSPSLGGATLDRSVPFDVEAGQPDNLSWVHAPAATQIAGRRWQSVDPDPMMGGTFPVAVRVNDQFGNLATNDFNTIVRLVATNNNPVNGGFQFNQRTAAGGIVDFGIDALQQLTYLTAETNIDVEAQGVPFSALVPVPDPVSGGQVTIVNNDAASMAFLTQPRSDGGPIVMGDPTNTTTDTQQQVEVQVFDEYGNLFVEDPDTMATANVTLRIPAAFNVGNAQLVLNDNPGTLTNSIVVTATGGTASFAGADAIQISRIGIGYRLQADSSGLPSVQSNFFDIVHGRPNSLNFTDEPESTHVDDQQQVQVEVLDRFGNRATSSESPQRQVELVLMGGTMGAAMQGITTVNPLNGLATFSDFQVDLVGTGYTIQARSTVPTTLLTDTSAPFDMANGLPVRVAFTGQPTPVAPPARVGEDISIQITYFDQFGNIAEFKLDGMTALDERAALLLVQGPSTGLCITGCEARGADAALPNGIIDYLVQVDRPTDGTPATGDDYTFRILPSNPLIFTDTNSSGIDVAVGDPDHLAFNIPPRAFETAGIPWAPFIVEVQDIFDNRIVSANGDLIELQETPASSNFDDTIAVQQGTLVNGRVTFGSIRHITAEVMEFDVVAPAGVSGTPVQAIDSPPASVTVEPDVPDNLTFENFNPALDDTNATTIAASSIVAGANWPDFEVTIRDAFGNRVDTNQVVTVSVDPTTGTGSLLGSIQVSAENGTARFIAGNPLFDDTDETPGERISYEQAEIIRLLANAGSVSQQTPSPEVFIRPAAPDHLTFLDDPTDGTTDDVQQIRVVQEDQFGNVVTDLATLPTQQRNVTLTVLDAAMMPFGAVAITPSDTQMTVDGEVTYNVQVQTPGIDYGLRASASGLVTSNTTTNGNTFDIINGGFANLQVAAQPMVTSGTVDDTFTVTVELQDGFGNRLCRNPGGTLLTTGPELELALVQNPAGASCINGCGSTATLGTASFAPGTMACNPGDAAWTFTGVTVDLPNDGVGGSLDEYIWEVRAPSGTPSVQTMALPDLTAGTPVTFEIVTNTDPVEIAGEVWAPLTVRLVDQRGNPSGSDNIEVQKISATGPLPGDLYPAHIGNPPGSASPVQGTTVVDSAASGSPNEATFNDLFATRAENMTFEVSAQTLGTVAPLSIDIRIDAAQLDHLTFTNAPFGVTQEAGVPFVDAGMNPANFIVDLRDAFENRVISNRAIDLTLTSGDQGAFTAANPGLLSVTANDGVATFPGIRHTVKETIVVGATAGPVLSTTASNNAVPVEAAAPDHMFVTQQPTSPVTADFIDAGSQQIVVELRDAFDNRVDGDVQGGMPAADDGAVQLVVTGSGDSPYNGNFVSGEVTFTITDTAAGAFTMNSVSTAIPGVTTPLAVNAFTVRNGVYSQIAITANPAAGQMSLDVPFNITFQIQDAFGNPITTGPSLNSPVALVLDAYTDMYGSFSPGDAGCDNVDGNPCTDLRNADAMGNVTFPNVSVNRIGTYRFVGENPGGTIASPQSTLVDRNAVGSPSDLVFVDEPDPIVTAGELWDSITLEIQDQFGNPAEIAHPIELVFNTGTLTSGTLNQMTSAVTSQVTFNDLYAETSGDYEFDVIDNAGVNPANGPSGVMVEVEHAEPDHLTFTNANLTPTFTAGSDFGGNISAATAGAETGIRVQVRDAFDNPIPTSRAITLEVTSGTDTLREFSSGGPVFPTDVGPVFANPTIGEDGTATFDDATYRTAETVIVGAFSGPLQSFNSYTITVTPDVQSQLSISKVERLDPMTFAATEIADLSNVPASLGRELNVDDQVRVTAQIRDDFGNAVDAGQDENVTIGVADDDGGAPAFTVAGGATQMTSNGQVVYVIDITESGDNYYFSLDDTAAPDLTAVRRPDPANFDVEDGALALVSIDSYTAPATVDDTALLNVELLDQYGNLIDSGPSLNAPVQVELDSTFSGPAGAGCVAGCGVDFTDATGTVTINTVQVDKSGPEDYAFRVFNPASGLDDTTAGAPIADGAPTQLGFITTPDPVQIAGQDFNTFTIGVQDQFGNLVEGAPATMVTLVPTVGALSGTVTEATAAGVATFMDVNEGTPGDVTFHGEDAAMMLTDTADVTVRIEPAQPHHLRVTSSPAATQTAGVNWTEDVVVQIEDAFDNIVQTGMPVTLRLVAGDGTLSGTTTVNAVGGIATFAMGSVSYDRVGQSPTDPTDPVFDAFTGPVDSLNNFSVMMQPGAPEQIIYSTGPVDVTQNKQLTVELSIADAFGNVVTGTPTSLNLRETTVNLVNLDVATDMTTGIATFNFNPAIAGTYTLRAGCTNLAPDGDCNATVEGNAPVLSTSFDVVPGSMQFGNAPRSIEQTGDLWTTNGADPITVELVDADGNVDPLEFDPSVRATLGSIDGGVLFSATGTGPGNFTLEVLDAATGATLDSAAPNLLGFNAKALEWDRDTGTLYGVTLSLGTASGPCAMGSPCLFTIDNDPDSPTFGVGTPVAQLGEPVAGLTFVDGTMYGFTASTATTPNSLHTVDTGTGAVTLVDQASGLAATPNMAAGFDITNDEIVLINAGDSGNLNVISRTTGLPGASVALNPSAAQPISDATFVEGAMFAIRGTGVSVNLIGVDTETGLISTVGAVTNNTVAVAWAHVPAGFQAALDNAPHAGATTDGVVSFGNISYPQAGLATLNIQSAGHGTILYTPVNVVTSMPHHLTLVQDPGLPPLPVVGAFPNSPYEAGAAFDTFAVEVRDEFENVIDVDGVTIEISGDGAETNGGFGAATAMTVDGVATFVGVTYDSAEMINVGADAIVTGLVLNEDTTLPVTVTPDFTSPATLRLVDAPNNPLNTQSFDAAAPWSDFDVEVVDPFGNNVGADGTVTISLGMTGGGTLTGTNLTTNLVGSVATFTMTNNAIEYDVAENITVDIAYNDDGTAPYDGTTAVNDIDEQPVSIGPGVLDHFLVEPAALTQTAGVGFNVTVTARDVANNTITDYDGRITFSSATDGGATLPADYTFLPSENGVHVFSGVVLTDSTTNVGAQTITVTDTVSADTGTSAGMTINPGALASFTVTMDGAATVNVAEDVTVTAFDAFGNVKTDYAGMVAFTSTDGGATLPGASALTMGTDTFVGAVTFMTAGTQTVTATDGVSGTSAGQTVSPNGTPASFDIAFSESTATVGQPLDVTVTARDAGGNVITGYATDVDITAGTDGALTPVVPAAAHFAGGSFTGGSATAQITFGTAGAQTITVAENGTANGSTVSGALSVQLPALVFGNAPRSAEAAGENWTTNGADAITVRAVDANGDLVSSYTGAVTFAETAGPAINNGTVAAVGGVASFTTLNATATGTITYDVDGVGATSITGRSITINANDPHHLTFVGTFPATETAGMMWAPSFTVEVRDANDNVVDVTGATITLSSDGAAFDAGNTAMTASGVATFTPTMNTAGTINVGADANVGGLVISEDATVSVTVDPDAAAQLVFTSPAPVDPTTDSLIDITVEVQDTHGNPVAPAAPLMVTLAFDADPTAGAATLSMMTNPITITGPATDGTFQDVNIDVADTGYSLEATGGGLAPASTGAFDIGPGAVSNFLVTPAALTQTAGVGFGVTVTARDANNNTVTDYDGRVSFTSTDAGATLPADYDFLPGENGVHVFSGVVLTDASGTQTITATDTVMGAVTGTSAAVTVDPGAIDSFTVAIADDPMTSGMASNVTVTALDAFGNTKDDYTGTVNFSSSDDANGLTDLPGATGTDSYTFLVGDSGVKLFDGVGEDALIFGTAGMQTLTATDSAASGSDTVTVNFDTTADSYDIAFADDPATVGQPVDVTITARDIGGNVITTYAADVDITAGTDATVVAAGVWLAGDFSMGVAIKPVTFSSAMAGPGHTITVAENTSGDGSTVSGDVDVNLPTLVFGDAPRSVETAGENWTTNGADPITVRAVDAGGNLVTGFTAMVTVTGAGITGSPVSVAAAGGVATFASLNATTATTGLGYTVTSAGNATGIVGLTIDIVPGEPHHLTFGGDAFNAAQDADTAWATAGAGAVTVTIEDEFNNTVDLDGVDVSLDLDGATAANGSFNAAATQATTNGVASFANGSVNYDTAEGPFDLLARATVGGLSISGDSGVNVTVSAGAADHLTFVDTIDPEVDAGENFQPVGFRVEIRDQFENVLTGQADPGDLTLTTDGTGTITNAGTYSYAAGVATFNQVGMRVSYDVAESFNLGVTSATLNGGTSQDATVAMTVNTGSPHHLTIVGLGGTQTAGVVWDGPGGFTVEVRDISNNVVDIDGENIMLSTDGAAFTAGDIETTTNGIATFDAVTVDVSGPLNVGADANIGGLVITESAVVNVMVDPDVPARLEFTSPAPTNPTTDSLINIDVEVQDALGNPTNPVADIMVTLAIGMNPGGAMLSVAVNPVSITMAQTMNTFTNVNLDRPGTGYTLVTTNTGGLTDADTGAFDIGTGAPATVTYTVQPPSSVAQNTDFSTAVRVQDAAGNNITGQSVVLSLNTDPTAGAATLDSAIGLEITTNSSGVAAFSQVQIDVASAGYDLLAGADAASSVSNGVEITNTDFANTPGGLSATGGMANDVKADLLGAGGNPDLVLASNDAGTTEFDIFTDDAAGGFNAPTNVVTGLSGDGRVATGLLTDGAGTAIDGNTDYVVGGTGGSNFEVYAGDGLGGVTGAAVHALMETCAGTLTDVAVADLTDPTGMLAADGSSDIVILCQEGVEIWANDVPGTNTFVSVSTQSFAVGATAQDFVIADLDGANDLDIVAVDSANDNLLVMTTNAGVISAVTTVGVGTAPVALAVGDVDGDGDLDVVTANSGSDDLTVLTNNGSAVFATDSTISVGMMPAGVAIGDFDGSNHDDIVASNSMDGTASVLLSNTSTVGVVGYGAASLINLGTDPARMITADIGDGGMSSASDGLDDVIATNPSDGDMDRLYQK